MGSWQIETTKPETLATPRWIHGYFRVGFGSFNVKSLTVFRLR